MNDNDKNTRIAVIIIVITIILITIAIIFAATSQREKSEIGGLSNIESNKPQTEQYEIIEDNSEETTEETTKQENEENTDVSEAAELELTDELKANAKKMTEKCQEEYEKGTEEGRYISSYGYLYDTKQKVNLEKEDVEENDESSDVAIHLFKPMDVHEYLSEEPEDEKLCVYTAVDTNEGILLTSKNGSGIITKDQYRDLILKYSPDNNGEPINPKIGSSEYSEITKAITKATGFSDYEIRHLACNDKYAVFVIGYPPKPDFIKECAMEKQNGTWKITYMGIEAKKNAIAEINEKYPDFDMALYPVYSIYDYITQYGLTTEAPNTEKMLKEKGLLTDADLPAAYVCGTGNFIYIEGAAGTKILGYKNASKQLEGFKVNNTFEAIAIMREKEENPPVFIIKTGDDMVK